VQQPGKSSLSYTIQVGDEAIVAPLGFFTPELLSGTDPKGIITQDRAPGDPEDPHDEQYLRDTTVNIHVRFQNLKLVEPGCYAIELVQEGNSLFSFRK